MFGQAMMAGIKVRLGSPATMKLLGVTHIWLVVKNISDFSIYWECHNPN
jgi:hypothetical protein